MAYITISSVSLDSTNKKLKISANVESGSGNYITAILGDTEKSFVCANSPSTLATKISIPNKDTKEYSTVTYDDNGNPIALVDFEIILDDITSGVLSIADIDKNIFFIFVQATVIIDSDSDTVYACGVTFNQNDLYQTVFEKIHSELVHEDCCNPSIAAAQAALLFESFQLSWSTSDPRKYIHYWNLLHNMNVSSSSKCACNG